MHWDDDPSHGTWRLMDGSWLAARIVHGFDGWRGYDADSGELVAGPLPTLDLAKTAVMEALGGSDKFGS